MHSILLIPTLHVPLSENICSSGQKWVLKKVKIRITFFVCLGLKRVEEMYGGYRKIVFVNCTNSIDDMGAPCRTPSVQDFYYSSYRACSVHFTNKSKIKDIPTLSDPSVFWCRDQDFLKGIQIFTLSNFHSPM